MRKKNHLYYFVLIIFVIIMGIASRKIDCVPLFLGDTLYAVMVYFGVRMFFINFDFKKSALLAIVFCFSIEFLQLYDAEWLLTIRRTSLGHYALGQGFLWSDLGFYIIGVLTAFSIEISLDKKNNTAISFFKGF